VLFRYEFFAPLIGEPWAWQSRNCWDSERMLLHIEQGKGRKDRFAMLSPRLSPTVSSRAVGENP